MLELDHVVAVQKVSQSDGPDAMHTLALHANLRPFRKATHTQTPKPSQSRNLYFQTAKLNTKISKPVASKEEEKIEERERERRKRLFRFRGYRPRCCCVEIRLVFWLEFRLDPRNDTQQRHPPKTSNKRLFGSLPTLSRVGWPAQRFSQHTSEKRARNCQPSSSGTGQFEMSDRDRNSVLSVWCALSLPRNFVSARPTHTHPPTHSLSSKVSSQAPSMAVVTCNLVCHSLSPIS